jgi:predicted ATPase
MGMFATMVVDAMMAVKRTNQRVCRAFFDSSSSSLILLLLLSLL